MKIIDWTKLTDEELLKALSHGEKGALTPLFERHSGRVESYCLKRGLPKERAQDVVQIVFMQLWRKKDLYSPRHAALAWIYVITSSELKDYKNREKRHLQAWDSLDALSQEAPAPPNNEQEESAEALLEGLKETEAQALRLRYLEEKEFSEIAKILQKSESNVRQIISRALKGLRHSKKEET